MTLFTLVNDPTFDPVFRVVNPGHGSRVDVKPWHGQNKTKIRNRLKHLRLSTLCCVCGGSPYTPLDAAGRRVCGYCRGLVRMMRTKLVVDRGLLIDEDNPRLGQATAGNSSQSTIINPQPTAPRGAA